ncbi:MAG: restriction endonuclease subunit S [Anaerolineaceae bacterium]|nr:MAG: restriction endonuclease subunit S [Anaerolineaceae bacterium]
MDAFAGAVGVSDSDGKGTPVYSVCQPINGANQYYYAYIVREMARTQWIAALATGIRERSTDFRYNTFANQLIPLPPPDEQAAIVTFLDAAETRIRRYIRAKQKLIKLLNEQKQAIIQQAVTRGLNPDAPMKDSGVEWLGEIPSHWEVRRFKFTCQITSGQIDPREMSYRDHVLIAPNHIESGTGRLLYTETADEQGAISGKYFVKDGQVIYSKIRPNLRKVTIAPFDCLCSADMYPITPNNQQIKPNYLMMLLLSKQITQFLVDASLRVAMPKVNREVLTNCWLWYPSVEEQDIIMKYLDDKFSPLDIAIEFAKNQIALIREYRTRLIADVVTGKVDVRGLTFAMPEAFDEDGLLDVDEDDGYLDDSLLDEDELEGMDDEQPD